MAVTPDKVQIGTSSDYLDGVAVDTAAGTGLFRETVVAADPENGEALARVRNAAPAVDDYGSVVRVAGAIDTGLIQPTTPADTQPVSGTITANQGASPYAVTQSGVWTVAVNNFPATQAVSGTVTANLGTLNGAATAAKQDLALAELQTLNSLVPSKYDDIVLTYTLGNLTGVVFKLGTATVSTLTLSYTAGALTRVQRS